MSDHRSTNGSHLDADIAFLTKHGVCVEHLVEVQKRADSLLQPAAKVFLSAGDISEERYCVLLARELGLEFCNEIFDPGEPIVQIPEPGAWDRMARMVSALAQVSGSLLPQPIFFIAPDALKIEALRKLLGRTPAAGKRLRLITHTLGMKHLVARASGALLDQAANGLVRMQPQQSAKSVVSAAQAVALVLLAELLLVLVYAAPET